MRKLASNISVSVGLLVVWGVFKWITNNLLWDWLVQTAETWTGQSEAGLIASVASYAIPTALTLAGGCLIYWGAKYRLSQPKELAAVPPADERLLIRDAARIAYERAETLGAGDVIKGINRSGEERLSYFICAFLLRKYPLMGTSPPSTVPRLIDIREYGGLNPVKGTSDLLERGALKTAGYKNVTIARNDLEEYIASLTRVSNADL